MLGGNSGSGDTSLYLDVPASGHFDFRVGTAAEVAVGQVASSGYYGVSVSKDTFTSTGFVGIQGDPTGSDTSLYLNAATGGQINEKIGNVTVFTIVSGNAPSGSCAGFSGLSSSTLVDGHGSYCNNVTLHITVLGGLVIRAFMMDLDTFSHVRPRTDFGRNCIDKRKRSSGTAHGNTGYLPRRFRTATDTTIVQSFASNVFSTSTLACGTTLGTYTQQAVDNNVVTGLNHQQGVGGLTRSTTYFCQAAVTANATTVTANFSIATTATPATTAITGLTLGSITGYNSINASNQGDADTFYNCKSNDKNQLSMTLGDSNDGFKNQRSAYLSRRRAVLADESPERIATDDPDLQLHAELRQLRREPRGWPEFQAGWDVLHGRKHLSDDGTTEPELCADRWRIRPNCRQRHYELRQGSNT